MAKKRDYTKEDLLKEFKHAIIDPRENITEFISTGSLAIDSKLNGGLARGFISEWWGPNRSGKSTAALKASSQVLKHGGTVIYVDAERGLDIGTEATYLQESADEKEERLTTSEQDIRNWLAVNGVNPYHSNFILMQPDSAEETYDILCKAVVNGIVDLAVIDSITAMMTKKEIAGEVGDSNYGDLARVNSQGLKRIINAFKRQNAHERAHIILINQARAKIGGMIAGTKPGGGFGVEHYASTRIKAQRTGSGSSKGEHVTNSRLKIEKCRWADQDEFEIQISNKRGIDTAKEILDYMVAAGYAHMYGKSYYYFYSDRMEEKEWDKLVDKDKHKDEKKGYLGTAHGESQAKEFVVANNFISKFYDEARNNWNKYF